ncbi:hypothetical protein [Streptomyces filamentosus]|uniref:hypothetical protein n=1 Tax=Streptomyces filamentosus TaxID=67294 RepID=UPI00331F9D9A
MSAAPILDPQATGATDRRPQQATADPLGETCLRQGGTRTHGLDTELTGIERAEFEPWSDLDHPAQRVPV